VIDDHSQNSEARRAPARTGAECCHGIRRSEERLETTYRFRRRPTIGAHPPVAGNYAILAAGTHCLAEVDVLDEERGR